MHALHADYPLAPEKREITYEMLSEKQRELLGAFTDNIEQYRSGKKLVPSLEPKRKYILHIRNLQLYLELGMTLKKVQRGAARAGDLGVLEASLQAQ